MKFSSTVAFEISVPGHGNPVSAQIADFGDRCVASVKWGSTSLDGLGATAREALVAALAPLGSRMTTAVMAEPAMFGASAKVLAGQAAT